MDAATNISKIIRGDDFTVYCSKNSSVEIFSYIFDKMSRIDIVYVKVNDNIKMVSVPSKDDGYYIVKNGEKVQLLRKGKPEYSIFLFDGRGRNDLNFNIESYDKDGKSAGNNVYKNVGFGTYVIKPIILGKSIITINGKLFYSFTDEFSFDTPKFNNSNVTVGVNKSNTTISIGGKSTSVKVGNKKVGLSVSQTVFKV